MKNLVSLVTLAIIVSLISCQPAATVLPIEQTEVDSVKPLIAKPIDTITPTDSAMKTDTVVDQTVTRVFSFNSAEAEKMFSEYLSLIPKNFTVTQTDSLYTIIYMPDSLDSMTALEPTTPILFTSVELEEPVVFKKDAHITLYSPFHDLSHVEQLFLSTDTAIVQVSKANSNTLLISTIDSDIDAFNVSTMLSDYAGSHPARLQSIVGPLKGLSNFLQGYESVVQGINPASTTELELSYTRRAPTLDQQSLQLLHFIGFPYRGTKSVATPTQSQLSYIGNSSQPHIANLIIEHSSDRDPLIQLSTGNGDGIILYQQENIALVKRRFSTFNLHEIDQRAYFLGINKVPGGQRIALASILLPEAISKNITTTITPIQFLGAQAPDSSIYNTGDYPNATKPELVMPTEIRLLCDPSDALALEISRKAQALLQKAGIKVMKPASNYADYQEGLVSKEYDILIGACSYKLAQTEIGQQFISRYWFRSIKPEEMRIEELYEIPLFTVPVYLAVKEGLVIPENSLRTIHQTR